MHLAVIGAGAFGGWTALHLLRQGARVTLIDRWGPGNSQSSSGGESRIIRATYGTDTVYTRFAIRALQLWKEHEERWKTRLYQRTGMLFLAGADDEFLQASEHALRNADIPIESWPVAQACQRFPQISFSGVRSVLYEPEAGVLTARENCRTVLKHFLAEGGTFQVASVPPLQLEGELKSLPISDGTELRADMYVFACGSWLGRMFPDVVADRIRPSRQDVLFFAPADGDARFSATQFPCWGDRTSQSKFYGIPDFQHRGFKIASDLRGADFDPDSVDRVIEPASVLLAREFLRERFPALARATLVESRVCQYENTPDLGLLIGRHPTASNVWLVGGGSGHGYKHGPSVGEHVAQLISGKVKGIPEFSWQRFERQTAKRLSSF